MRKRVLLIGVMIVLVCFTGCAKKSKPTPPLGPNWDIWSNPSTPDALTVNDPQGDDPSSFGDGADWRLIRGTYDGGYAYLWFDLWSITGVDKSGDVSYSIAIDANNNGGYDIGDYLIVWNAIGGFMVSKEPNSPVPSLPELYCRIGSGDDIEIAISRSAVNPAGFCITGFVLWWDGANWQDGDFIPDSALGMAQFTF